jgi:hypothetical protein
MDLKTAAGARDLKGVIEKLKSAYLPSTPFFAVECERHSFAGSVAWTAWIKRDRDNRAPIYYSYTIVHFVGDASHEALSDDQYVLLVVFTLLHGEVAKYPYVHEESDIDLFMEPSATGHRVYADTPGNHAGSTHGDWEDEDGD